MTATTINIDVAVVFCIALVSVAPSCLFCAWMLSRLGWKPKFGLARGLIFGVCALVFCSVSRFAFPKTIQPTGALVGLFFGPVLLACRQSEGSSSGSV